MHHRHKTASAASAAVALLALGAVTSGVVATTPAGGATARRAGIGCHRPLNILLTNDDGYAADGINAVYQALVGEGEHVKVVAPATNQTGQGGALAYGGTLTVTQPVAGDPNVYAVSGSPSDSVALALGVLYPNGGPDLVISGANAGTNLSRTINHSGTVGAAVTAMDLGVPAIAVSSAHPAEFDPHWDGTGSMNYSGTGTLLRRIVRTLQRTADGCRKLMPGRLGLNVNYPAGTFKGTRVTTLGTREPIPTTYTPTGAGQYKVGYSLDPLYAATDDQQGRTTIDYRLVARGFASITPLDGSLGVQPPGHATMAFVDRLVARLNRTER
ncbi:5'/3'-nucleotidase SurE [Nocardioides panacihumi]|uniref:5'-nucleotidase SurE n=1 Tax=Nocardioides panacihumi TaxID=400774 RepID=A0ABN2QBJ7_9ACTN